MGHKAKRLYFFNTQNGKCAYCFERMTMRINRKNTCTLDRIVPRSQGGPSTIFNLVGACFDCNNKKGDKPLSMFLRLIDEKRQPQLSVGLVD